MSQLDEKSAWNATTKLLVKESYKFGPHWSFNFRNDPKRLAFVLSRGVVEKIIFHRFILPSL